MTSITQKLPETLCRSEVCTLLGLDEAGLQSLLVRHSYLGGGGFRRDGTMKTSTARKLADQTALERLKACRTEDAHPRHHEGHHVCIPDGQGPRCEECDVALFPWPESYGLAFDNPEWKPSASQEAAVKRWFAGHHHVDLEDADEEEHQELLDYAKDILRAARFSEDGVVRAIALWLAEHHRYEFGALDDEGRAEFEGYAREILSRL